jgi:DNA polymerase-4
MQIRKLGDIRRYDPKILNIKFGKLGHRLLELANGIDPCVVETSYHRKSISKEITLSHDTCDLEFIRLTLLSLSHQVGAILRQQNKVAQTIVIKLKFSDFKQITRSLTPGNPVCSSLTIFKSAFSLFQTCRIQQKIRLIGVGVSSIRENSMPVQMEMFSSKNELNQKWEHVDMAIDSICRKFGPDLVKKAALTNLPKEEI